MAYLDLERYVKVMQNKKCTGSFMLHFRHMVTITH